MVFQGLMVCACVHSLYLAVNQEQLVVQPAIVELSSPLDQVQLRVLDKNGKDQTAKADFKSLNPELAAVSKRGEITPTKNGETRIVVSVNSLSMPILVKINIPENSYPTFEKDIQPILTRFSCNSGPCHGKQRGQNGFQLSLLGFDNDFDYQALTSEARGRRLFPSSPESSLLIRKASGAVPHGGGKKLNPESSAYSQVLSWIRTGAPRTKSTEAKVIFIEVFPSEAVLGPKERIQIRVLAHFQDGAIRDVTHLSAFQSSESVMTSVDSHGLVETGALPGEAAIMARYMEKFAVCLVTMPLVHDSQSKIPQRLDSDHFIDKLLSDKYLKLGLAPSAAASDSTFLRRIYLDLIGRLPTPEESKAWLADTSADKKEKLANSLLNRSEYADFWANKWADLLRPNPFHVGMKAVFVLHSWLRDVFRKNTPFDQFAREVIMAEGSTFRDGASVIIRDKRTPDEITTVFSRLFLGIRLECAKCHHHPFEVYGQDDFYQFAAFFGRIGRKGVGISAPISGSEEMFFLAKKGVVKHPRTGEEMKPAPLKGTVMEFSEEEDPRQALANWVTSNDNPFFAKAVVNRVWADLMGRGLVEPVDDLRATNPPTNPALLEALAENFRSNGYDLKRLLFTIVTSKAYGLASTPNSRNMVDTRNHSRHYRVRPRAEVLLDMVCDVTGVKETFPAMPAGSRAMEMWTFRSASEFLDSFGRPDPNQDPPCERSAESTVVQALHLMNGKSVHAKIISDDGLAAALAASPLPMESLIEKMYLQCYCRFPSSEELNSVLALAQQKSQTKRQTLENLLWALINSPEFVLID